MNKSDLTRTISLRTGFTQKKSEQIITATLNAITDELARGGKVQIVGFGAFEVKHREARMGSNPKTKEQVEVAARKIPSFRPGVNLKEAVSGLKV